MKILKPQLVCAHGTVNCPNSEQEMLVTPDSQAGRTVEYWLERVPQGVSFSVQLWPHGWASGPRHMVMHHHVSELAGELEAPPVAGTAPQQVRVILPHGVVRQAMLSPVSGERTYHMRSGPGDSRDLEEWEAVAPTKTIRRIPGSKVLRDVLKRLKPMEEQRDNEQQSMCGTQVRETRGCEPTAMAIRHQQQGGWFSEPDGPPVLSEARRDLEHQSFDQQ